MRFPALPAPHYRTDGGRIVVQMGDDCRTDGGRPLSTFGGCFIVQMGDASRCDPSFVGRGQALLILPSFLVKVVSKTTLTEGDSMRVESESPQMDIGRHTQQCTFSREHGYIRMKISVNILLCYLTAYLADQAEPAVLYADLPCVLGWMLDNFSDLYDGTLYGVCMVKSLLK